MVKYNHKITDGNEKMESVKLNCFGVAEERLCSSTNAIFDNDLLLFKDISAGYFASSLEDFRIIGGRASSQIASDDLKERLNFVRSEEKFFLSSLYDTASAFSLAVSKNQVVLIYNRLFRSCGLGVAVLFFHSPTFAACAHGENLLRTNNTVSFSPKLLSLSRTATNRSEEHGAVDFSTSFYKTVSDLSSLTGEESFNDMISAASRLCGCGIELDKSIDIKDGVRASRDAMAAFLLTAFSLCRRLSADRSARLDLCESESGLVIKLGFKRAIGVAFDQRDRELLLFLENTARKFEAPLSIDITGDAFTAEFVPMRADPSLCGLKAGIRIR